MKRAYIRPAETHQSQLTEEQEICPIYKKCSGCQMQNLPYPDQLRWKQSQVKKLLGRYGSIPFIIGMAHPYHYRNKVQVAFGRTRAGKTVTGIWQSKEQRIAITDSCMIEDRAGAEIAASLRRLLPAFKLAVWDPRTGQGFFRHLLVRRAVKTGQLMVVLVGATPVFPQKAALTKALLKAHPDITTVVFVVNDQPTNLLLGQREEVLYGPGYIEDQLCGLTFRISPRSFYQVNPTQTEILYQKAIQFAGLTGTETVIDAYCGIGTIGMCAAAHAGQVIGVESNPAAVRDARENARRNGVKNIQFTAADAGRYLTEMAESELKADVLLMDPPRAGSDRRFLSAVLKMQPGRIVYISCNPETQARDLAVLVRGGYQVKKIQPVDMFPWTHHVECVVSFSKGDISTKNIRVEFPLDEMDMEGFLADGTYKQIQEYVLEHTGLKVSALYIAQVKAKHGIIERENYNKPKTEGNRVPKCPPEKEKAIEDAMKHFGMIP